MGKPRKEFLNIDCKLCGSNLTVFQGEKTKFDNGAKINIACPECHREFGYNIERRNIQCPECEHIDSYIYDKREGYDCVKCEKPMNKLVTQNAGSLVKETCSVLLSFPSELEDVKSLGLQFVSEVIDRSNNHGDNQHLKTFMGEFLRSCKYLAEHYKKFGVKEDERENDTESN